MKNKIITLIVLIFLSLIIVGCTNKSEPVKEEKKENEGNKDTYIKYVQELKKEEESSENLPFDVNVEYTKENDNEIRFEVSVDNVKGTVKNITALAIHDKQTDDVFPSVGIFDDTVTLTEGEKPEGVVLAGYIPYTGSIDDLKNEITVKVLIKYEYENKKITAYYVTKNNYISFII